MTIFLSKNNLDLPDPGKLPLKPYRVDLPLYRLKLGTDNIRYDVHLSRGFCSATNKIALRLIARHANAEAVLRIDKTTNWIKERDEFKGILGEIMITAINKAKMEREIQVDYLAQVAVVKYLVKALKEQFEEFINQFKEIIRIQELSDRGQLHRSIKLKEQLNEILQKKITVQYNAGKSLFEYLTDVLQQDSYEAREANFGIESILSEDLFTNPMLVTDNPFYDLFLIEEYDILMGNRLEDPDKYESLLFELRVLFSRIGLSNSPASDQPDNEPTMPFLMNEDTGRKKEESIDNSIDRWMNRIENISTLFDYFSTNSRIKSQKLQKVDKAELTGLNQLSKTQKQLFDFFFTNLNKTGLVKRIAAYYEIKTVYHVYCPPLRPQQVLQFLISSKHRKEVIRQLNRLKGHYSKPLDLKPLLKRIKMLKRINSAKKKAYLFQFLKSFIRYHRDLLNYTLLKNTLETVNVLTDEKRLNLSRTNNTLYEFLLPHEEVTTEKPIINHVVLKADVRGSTDLTYRMRENGLNPASYFSLNFFDPITDILPAYGAVKVFIEGDALILAIYEEKDSPGQWYNVSRACGLAVSMLFIVQQYNNSSRKYNLPILELGIGICFQNDTPAFLFDGDQRIMISPAINLADRLSACSKDLRKVKAFNDSPFNLYVFKDEKSRTQGHTVDDVFIRYNVNGIELNENGFKKLSEEIDLKILDHKISNERSILYTGKFPTLSGRYQQLVIRESQVQTLNTSELKITGMLSRKFYEVVTNPKLYEFAKQR